MESACDIRSENFSVKKGLDFNEKRAVKYTSRKPVPIKWVFNSKEEVDGLIFLNPRNVVNRYMQVPGVDFTESFLSIASYT